MFTGLTQLATLRELMVALQWINMKHEASDLQLFFTDDLYSKIVELSCVPSTEVSALPSPPPSTVWERVKRSCALLVQFLAMEIRYDCVLALQRHISHSW